MVKHMLILKFYLLKGNLVRLSPFFLISLIFFSLSNFPVRAQGNEDSKDKKETALVKIFNACHRGTTPLWQTGVDLKFKDQLLADDIRVAEVSAPREIEFQGKDTVDVFRNENFMTEKRTPTGSFPKAAARAAASFLPQSISVLLVEGDLMMEKENLSIKIIQEFPQPDGVLKPTTSRVVLISAREGEDIHLDLGGEQRVTLKHGDSKEFFLSPGEKEINLIYLKDDSSVKRQLSVFKFEAGKYYTGILLPGSEKPDRPLLRFSDSNDEWATIQSKNNENLSKTGN
jgi:hypothetical protein